MLPIAAPHIHRRQVWRADAVPQWCLLDTVFTCHQSLPHASPGWIVTACEDGLEAFLLQRQSLSLPPKTIVVLPPAIIHANRAGWAQSCHVQVLYLPPVSSASCALPTLGLYARRIPTQVRAAARAMLQGESVLNAALAAGFWDQSHLHRHFMGVYGMTPVQFRQENLVQDALL